MPAHASTCWKRAVPACADFAVYVPSLFAICHQKVYLTLFVYLGFSWLLHIGIWGIPGVPGHGIGGKYAQLQQQLKECACNGSIPGSVTAIYVLQLVLFTVFGLVCTLQVVMALSLTAKKKRCEHRRNDVNTVVMFFSVRTKKLPFRLLQVRWLDTAGFAGFGIHAPTMVEPKRGGSAF
jgi:hypothetical protein